MEKPAKTSDIKGQSRDEYLKSGERPNKKVLDIKPPHHNIVLPLIVIFLIIVSVILLVLFIQKMNTNKSFVSTTKGLQGVQQAKTVSTTTLPQKTTKEHREVGNAGDLYPYGKTDELTYREFEIDNLGGSIPATLSGNIQMYLVYPKGLASGQVIQLTPYYSMPTAANAVPLSNELGYGLDIQFQGSRHGELPSSMYLVFDLDGGKTIQKIRHDSKISFFCDPGVGTFDPSVCALLNNVPISSHTNSKYGVVSPIRSENLTNMADLVATIPIGFDNLIVAEISGEGTYIPQKLSKDLLSDIIKANGISSETTIYRVEGVVQAVNNQIYMDDDVVNMYRGLTGSTPIENIKILQTIPLYRDFINKLKTGKGLTDQEKELANILVKTNFTSPDSESTTPKDLKEEIYYLSRDRNHSTNIITAAAMMQRLEKAKLMDFTKEKAELLAFLQEDFDYFYDEEDTSYLTNILLAEAILYMPNNLSSAQTPDLFRFVQKVYADRHGVVDGPPEWFDQVNKTIDKICSNPNSSSTQLRNTMEVAGRTGEMGRLATCQKKMCDKLRDDLKNTTQTPIRVAQDWGMYQGSCEDDDNRDKEYTKKLTDSYSVLVCTTLLEKNLINFAWNEVHCSEVLKKDTTQAKKEGLENARERLRNSH